MRLFKWTQGRQLTTNYKKLCFLYFKFGGIGLDGYILKYEPKTHLGIHKDPIENARHYRLNIKLKGNSRFWCPTHLVRIKDFFILFRPDIHYHSLAVYTKTYKLSLGIAIFKKTKL